MLDRGGNAIDAGVAGGLVLNVVQPDMCNFGGVAPILVRPAGERRGVERRRPRDVGARGDARGVPGAVRRRASRGAGERGRARRARRLADRARALGHVVVRRRRRGRDRARRGRVRARPAGGVLDRPARRATGTRRARSSSRAGASRSPATCCASPSSRRCCGGWRRRRDRRRPRASSTRARSPGARRVQPRGRRLARRSEDLAEFRAEVAPAVSRPYGGWLVHTPDTWCQGPALLQMLAILDGLDLPALGHNTAEYLHVARRGGEARVLGPRALVRRSALRRRPARPAALGRARRRAARADRRARRCRTCRRWASHVQRSDTTYLCVVDARRQRLQRHAERHARVGPARAGARDRGLAARPPEPARPVASGRARARASARG